MKEHLQKFFKYASLYMSSSVDSLTAFRMARRRVRHKKLLVHVDEMIALLSRGLTLSRACATLKKGGHLDGVSWSIISTADRAGSIGQSCDQVYRYMAAAAKLKNSIISSMIYPLGVVSLAVSMVIFLITFIFPKIIPLFSSLQATIPPATAFLIMLSDFLRRYILHVIGGIVGAALIFSYSYSRNKRFKFNIQASLLKLPFVKRIIFAKESQCLALSCGTLMRGGKSLVESLAIARDASDNLVIASFDDAAIVQIEQGRKMSEVFSPSVALLSGHGSQGVFSAATIKKMFEGEWVDLVAVGEMSGALPRSFSEIAEFYEGRLKDDLELVSRWSEPVALAISASVILIVAMSVIQPMYAILQYVHS